MQFVMVAFESLSRLPDTVMQCAQIHIGNCCFSSGAACILFIRRVLCCCFVNHEYQDSFIFMCFRSTRLLFVSSVAQSPVSTCGVLVCNNHRCGQAARSSSVFLCCWTLHRLVISLPYAYLQRQMCAHGYSGFAGSGPRPFAG